MKIIIAGGGIGGLVAAINLHNSGHHVTVFESTKEVKPLGVGINLLPHCVRVLDNLGLLNDLKDLAVETKELVYANKHGQFFWQEPRGMYAGYKWSQFSLHRGEFQILLWNKAVEILGDNCIYPGHHISSFEQDENSITAHFVDKDSGEIIHSESGDLLIGADGINSQIRRLLYPDEGPVVYSGNVLYRGTAVMKPFLTEATMAMIGSMKQKMVVYPIKDAYDDNGNQLINWVANLKGGLGATLTERDWNRQADKNQLLEKYADWKFDWLDVPYMIEHSNSGIFEFPMSDRNPLHRWSFNRVTLLGDAAHPMYPIGSNGASQAILDVEALTNSLNQFGSLSEALNNYDKIRIEATAKVVYQNREKGPDIILDLMEERFPNGFSNHEIPHKELDTLMEKYKKIAGFDMETLNAI
jgi:2-polyprenyl-6-methoxyphenol hydroxylase-like FAD-dependent oxidoreductase